MDYVARVPAAPLDSVVDDVYVLTGTPRHRRLNVPQMPSTPPPTHPSRHLPSVWTRAISAAPNSTPKRERARSD